MHEIHGGPDLRPHDDYGISLPLIGQHLVFAFSWAHCGSTVFSLALTASELRALFFLFPGSILIYMIVSPW